MLVLTDLVNRTGKFPMEIPEGANEYEAVRQMIVKNEKPVPEKIVTKILLRLMEVLYQENNVVLVTSPITIVGDIHGQLDDLLGMFVENGSLDRYDGEWKRGGNACKYLFMGDYVDRGYHSLNTFLYLACLKLQFPDTITLLRGNHESRQVSNRYGFYFEIILNYGGPGLWMMCNDVFDLLPMAALVDEDVFCVHGGLSPKIPMIENISLLDRQQELPSNGPLADLCWSDPENVREWRENSRGAGYLFGRTQTMKFTRINRLECVCRSHQLAMEGYIQYFGDDEGERPRPYRLVTIWSAPNYTYKSGNLAAVMRRCWPGHKRDEMLVYNVARDRITPSEEEQPVASQYFA